MLLEKVLDKLKQKLYANFVNLMQLQTFYKYMMMMLMNKGQSTQLCPLYNEQHILHTPNDLAMTQHILDFKHLSNQMRGIECYGKQYTHTNYSLRSY